MGLTGGEVSNGGGRQGFTTRIVVYWLPVLGWAALIFYLSSIPSLKTDFGFIDWVLRKLSHVVEYFVLCYLMLRAAESEARLSRFGFEKLMAAAALAAIAFAMTDEFHQSLVPGREGKVTDVLIDGLGIVVLLLLVRRRQGSRPGRRF